MYTLVREERMSGSRVRHTSAFCFKKPEQANQQNLNSGVQKTRTTHAFLPVTGPK